MSSRESAYVEVERLVKKFKTLPTAARRAYNEDNTRKDFVLPLFRALEWNVDDAAEVSAEEKVSRGWVDFAFRLSGIPRFFLETKKIAEDLTKLEWVRQAIDYAWTKSVTWALLSDFEGLRVFNAEWKEDNPLRAQFLEFGVDTYLSDFERLWWLSRPEIAAGTLDREAEKVGKKTPKEPVSQRLFDDLKEWRRELFRHLRAYNKRYSPAQIDEAVLRILNRLIFVRAAEDRAVEPPRLRPLLRELDDRRLIGRLPAKLAELFRELDAAYDSDLFAEHLSEKLDCEPEPFRVLIEGLHEKPGSYVRYNFNAIDADVLGTVYEQYLGHVFTEENVRRTSESASHVEEKRRKRKAQGIYYTPTFVVKYIVQQTLGRHLAEHGYNRARPARVLDMACGSGSFLIEAFDVLDRHLAREQGQARGDHEDVIDYARRMEILSKNIYGVDKDDQAVAVARLNLLLKALHVRDRLPMLTNIRAGDSLISGAPDELKAAFGKDWPAKKPFNWEAEFAEVMKDGGFDVIVGNPPYVRIQTLSKDEVAFFNERFAAATGNYDIYVLFVERALQWLRPGGVMGFILPNKFFNTTYGAGLRKLITDAKALWKVVDFGDAQVFGGATTYTCLLFLQKRPSSEVIFVPANEWLKTQDAMPKVMPTDLPKYTVKAENFSDSQWTFVVGTSAALFERLRAMPVKLGNTADIFVGLQTSADDVFIMDLVGETQRTLRLWSKALNTAWTFEKGLLFPLVSGTDVKSYGALPERQYILFPYEVNGGKAELIDFKVMSKRYARTAAYLLENKKRLEEREKGKARGPQWYGYIYRKNMTRQSVEKLCVPRLVDKLYAAYDVEGTHFLDNVDVGGITLKAAYQLQGLMYLLALLNSKLLRWYFPLVSVPFRGGWWSANRQFLSQIPIRLINLDDPAEKQQHDALVALVEEMLQLQKHYAEAEREKEDRRHALKRRIDEVDAAIDRMVYQLYGLTEEEIRIVEGERTSD